MREEEVQLLDAINKNEVEKVRALLLLPTVSANCVDDTGMTPLSHACFKGKLEIIEELLLRGANVNSCDHKQGYTPLMFAALSGKIDCVKRLLHAGAKTHPTNTVNRTASQMAAFVGNHAVVTVINNYVAKSALERYSKPDGVNQEVRLPPELVDPLHALLISSNISPVKIGLHILKHRGLLENHKKIVRVLDDMCTRNFQNTEEPNEILSLKCHVLAYVIKKAGKEYSSQQDNDLKEFLKTLLKGPTAGDAHDGEEQIFRNAIRDYPYGQSTLFQQIIRQLTHSPIGGELSAYAALHNIWNGQQMFSPSEKELEDAKTNPTGPCGTCHEPGASKVCAQCRSTFYCDPQCQRLHWPYHKKSCLTLKAQKESQAASKETKSLNEEKEEKTEVSVKPNGDASTENVAAEGK